MHEPEEEQKYSLQTALNQMGSLAGQIAGLSLFLVLGAVFGGKWLDEQLGTGHVIMIALVLGAGPLSLFLTYKLALRAARKMPVPKIKTNSQASKEDDTGEQ